MQAETKQSNTKEGVGVLNRGAEGHSWNSRRRDVEFQRHPDPVHMQQGSPEGQGTPELFPNQDIARPDVIAEVVASPLKRPQKHK